MKSAAGDPELRKLFFSQLRDEAGQSTMLREVDDGGFIEIRSVFAMTLACAFVAFSSVASAADIRTTYLSWPIVHQKKTHGKPGAPSQAAWRHRQQLAASPAAGSWWAKQNWKKQLAKPMAKKNNWCWENKKQLAEQNNWWWENKKQLAKPMEPIKKKHNRSRSVSRIFSRRGSESEADESESGQQ